MSIHPIYKRLHRLSKNKQLNGKNLHTFLYHCHNVFTILHILKYPETSYICLMHLERYIGTLLYRYQCVVVPHFGAFLSRTQSAWRDMQGVWNPPAKLLSFNVQLQTNDGLLATYIAKDMAISYEEAMSEIARTVMVWNEQIGSSKKIYLEGLGELWFNEHKSLQFQPTGEVSYLPSSFGLRAVTASPIVRSSVSLQTAASENPKTIPPLAKSPRKPVYMAYAASFLVFISLGITGYSILKNKQLRYAEMAQREAQQQVEKTIQQAVFFDSAPVTLPAVTLQVARERLPYHVVAGAFRFQENADKKALELVAKGYTANQPGTKNGLYIVTYGSFSRLEEALSFLQLIRKKETQDSWLWVSE